MKEKGVEGKIWSIILQGCHIAKGGIIGSWVNASRTPTLLPLMAFPLARGMSDSPTTKGRELGRELSKKPDRVRLIHRKSSNLKRGWSQRKLKENDWKGISEAELFVLNLWVQNIKERGKEGRERRRLGEREGRKVGFQTNLHVFHLHYPQAALWSRYTENSQFVYWKTGLTCLLLAHSFRAGLWFEPRTITL